MTHPSIRATGFALNILVIHLLGDAISPPIVGAMADHSRRAGVPPQNVLDAGFWPSPRCFWSVAPSGSGGRDTCNATRGPRGASWDKLGGRSVARRLLCFLKHRIDFPNCCLGVGERNMRLQFGNSLRPLI